MVGSADHILRHGSWFGRNKPPYMARHHTHLKVELASGAQANHDSKCSPPVEIRNLISPHLHRHHAESKEENKRRSCHWDHPLAGIVTATQSVRTNRSAISRQPLSYSYPAWALCRLRNPDQLSRPRQYTQSLKLKVD